MPIIVGHRRIVGDVTGTIARLESLLSALERLGRGDMPSSQDIDAAPFLNPYGLGTVSLPCLVGGNHGHPERSGLVIRTSDLWAFAPELGWARTSSRLYRLGEPVHAGPAT